MVSLVRQGHEVLLIGPGNKGVNPETGPQQAVSHNSTDRELLSRIRTVGLPSIRTPFDGYPLAIPRRPVASRSLEEFQPDVISIQTVGPVAFLGLSLADRHDVNSILSWHTDFETYTRTYPIGRALAWSAYLALALDRRRNSGRRRARRPLPVEARPARRPRPAGRSRIIAARTLRLATEQVSAVWAPSRSALRQIREFGVDRPVFLLPAEVRPQDLGVGTPAARQALDRLPGRGQRPYLLYVGRLSREKNLHLLLAAFKLLADVDPSALLVLVGPEQDTQIRDRLESFRREQAGQVVVAGALPRTSLGEIYRGATSFVTPSLSDTQCLCVSEALSVGVPVLVVDPGLAEDRPAGSVRVVEPVPARLAAAMGRELARAREARVPVGVGAGRAAGLGLPSDGPAAEPGAAPAARVGFSFPVRPRPPVEPAEPLRPGMVRPRASVEIVRPQTSAEIVRPQASGEIVRPRTSGEIVRPGMPGGMVRPTAQVDEADPVSGTGAAAAGRGLVIRPRQPGAVGPARDDLATRFVSATTALGSADPDASYHWDGWSWVQDD